MPLTAVILGSAAGGGYPQWNCNCDVCALAWAEDPRVSPRGQTTIAVSADGENWLLCNASSDLRTQILDCRRLHPRAGLRQSPIKAVILTGAEIDQAAGLLSLRERSEFTLYATESTLTTIAGNPMFGVLSPAHVTRRILCAGERIVPVPGLEVTAFYVPGKVPLYLESGGHAIAEGAENVGLELASGGRSMLFIPGAASVTPAIAERMRNADAILFDGTLFTDDEMIVSGAGEKTGRRMGHMPIAGSGGSLEVLAEMSARRIYIHINNTNPILIEGAPERQRVEAAGIEIAHDGIEIVL